MLICPAIVNLIYQVIIQKLKTYLTGKFGYIAFNPMNQFLLTLGLLLFLQSCEISHNSPFIGWGLSLFSSIVQRFSCYCHELHLFPTEQICFSSPHKILNYLHLITINSLAAITLPKYIPNSKSYVRYNFETTLKLIIETTGSNLFSLIKSFHELLLFMAKTDFNFFDIWICVKIGNVKGDNSSSGPLPLSAMQAVMRILVAPI